MMNVAKGLLSVVCQHFQRTFPLDLNSTCSLQAKRERFFFLFGQGHMTKTAAMPIYGKDL